MGMQRVAEAMLRPVHTHVMPGSPDTASFEVSSGVPQGCPMSGATFAVASLPLLLSLRDLLGEDAVFGFADDVAILVRGMEELRAVAATFAAFSAATSLQLNIKKTVLVPLRGAEDWDATAAWYRRALAMVATQWSEMAIVASTAYLGQVVGPGATVAAQWAAAWSKHDSRVAELAAGRGAPSAARAHYVSHIRPVLGYAAQTLPPPPDLRHREAVTLQRLWRFPHRAIPPDAIQPMREMGLPVPAGAAAAPRPGAMRPPSARCCRLWRRPARRRGG